MTTRLGVGGLGVLIGIYGAYLLLRLGWENTYQAAVWLVAGVVLHDFILSLVLLGLGVVVAMTVAERVRGPVVAGLVVLGTVTLMAVPMLGRFGEKASNPSLLNRNYTAGWFVFAALVAVVTAAVVVRRLRATSSGPPDPEGADREPTV